MPRSIRGARPIVVDGRRLFWRFDDEFAHHPEGWPYQLTVYTGAGGTSRLLAHSEGTDLPFLPYKKSRMTPRLVEIVAREGLNEGWDPDSRRPDHVLSVDYLRVILRVEYPDWPPEPFCRS